MAHNIFPPLSKEEILKRVEDAWDLSGDFPMPKDAIRCPVCGSKEIQARSWSFFPSPDPNSRIPYRCDISFKCTRCSAVWIHGVAIPKEMYKKHASLEPGKRASVRYSWREVKKILEQQAKD